MGHNITLVACSFKLFYILRAAPLVFVFHAAEYIGKRVPHAEVAAYHLAA
jgi:hypothetical protein